MTNSKILFQEIVARITLDESKEEVESIVYRLLESKFSLSRTDILLGKETGADIESLDQFIAQINCYEPIQYILQEEYFFGRKFFVDSSVLIPRPETEELIQHVLSNSSKEKQTIVDIGTGSGCIAITLSLEMPQADVMATDVSEAALITSNKNNTHLSSTVKFIRHDILNQELPHHDLDWIVSNPPYIATSEKESLSKTVRDYEPHLALFAENDPLIFYKAIAKQAALKLKKNGRVIVEINERLGEETAFIFEQHGLMQVQILKDMYGKNRFILARRA
jgi:release factor glutamine methyltransferase